MEDADAKLDAELISLRERKATASLLYPTEFLLGIVYVKWMCVHGVCYLMFFVMEVLLSL